MGEMGRETMLPLLGYMCVLNLLLVFCCFHKKVANRFLNLREIVLILKQEFFNKKM